MCDEIINVANSVSTNVTNTMAKNVRSTVSINSDDNKVTCEKEQFPYSHYLISNYKLIISCYSY